MDADKFRGRRYEVEQPKRDNLLPNSLSLKKVTIEFINRSFHLLNDRGNKPLILNGRDMNLLVKNLKKLQPLEESILCEIEEQFGRHAEREGEQPLVPDREVTSVTLSNNGTWEFRLILNVYKANTGLWLKMIRHDKEEPEVDHWCKGGIRFVQEDDVDALQKFVSDCILFL